MSPQISAQAFTLVSCSVYFFDPDDGGDMSSETSVDTQQTTQRHILENDTLHDSISTFNSTT
jgi:hypothetical protein